MRVRTIPNNCPLDNNIFDHLSAALMSHLEDTTASSRRVGTTLSGRDAGAFTKREATHRNMESLVLRSAVIQVSIWNIVGEDDLYSIYVRNVLLDA